MNLTERRFPFCLAFRWCKTTGIRLRQTSCRTRCNSRFLRHLSEKALYLNNVRNS